MIGAILLVIFIGILEGFMGKIYTATLERDCTPHYFYTLDNAIEYIEKDYKMTDISNIPIVWNHSDNMWCIDDFGWISVDEFEEDK